MGVRAKNLAALFADVRTRTIIIITSVVLIIGIIVGYSIFHSRTQTPAKVELAGTPGYIQSTPGSFNPSARYAQLQEEQNIRNAQEAEQTGGSAIPTIIGATRTTQGQFNAATTQATNQPWQAGLPFTTLSRVEQENFTPKEVALSNLKNSGCSPEALAKARQLGATPEELRAAGCSAEQLMKAGFDPNALQKAGFSACDVISNNNLNPAELKKAGYTAGELRGVGFNPCQLKHAGFTAPELIQAGVTPDELKGVGFTPDQIAAAEAATPAGAATESPVAGLPSGLTETGIKAAGYAPSAVRKDRQDGVSASQMRELGATPAELKAGGYTASELCHAGYTPGELLKAGYTPEELKAAGCSIARTVALPPGVTLSGLQAAGCDPTAVSNARAQGVSATAMREVGCTPEDLKKGGYTASELKNAGFSPGALAKAGFTPAELRQAGYTANQLRKAGFSPEQLHNAGYTAADLKNAGYTPEQLRKAGYTANDLRAAGFTPEQMKNAGYTAGELKNAGYTPKQLRDIGFMPEQIRQAGYSPQELAAEGISPPIAPAQPSSIPSALGDAGGSTPAQLAQTQQEEQLKLQQQQQLQQQLQSSMQTQIGELFTAWKPSAQKYEEAEKETTVATTGATTATGPGEEEEEGATTAPPLVKAGTIMFAVLETAVNSDQPGPVLATIVEGKLKGAKLLGRMTTFGPHGQAVMLTFDLLTLPRFPSSVRIDAVGIDPDTARTALSSYTNNHYLLRYGSLFAASFLEGYGQAFLQSGQTTFQTANTLTTISPNLSAGGKVFVALGNVGNKFGSALEEVVNMPPTVHIYSGSGIGILFMTDLAHPASANHELGPNL